MLVYLVILLSGAVFRSGAAEILTPEEPPRAPMIFSPVFAPESGQAPAVFSVDTPVAKVVEVEAERPLSPHVKSLGEAARILDVEKGSDYYRAARAYRVALFGALRDKQMSQEKQILVLTRLHNAHVMYEAYMHFKSRGSLNRELPSSLDKWVALTEAKGGNFSQLFEVPDLRENMLWQFNAKTVYLRGHTKNGEALMRLIDLLGSANKVQARIFLREAYIFLYSSFRALEIAPSAPDVSVVRSVGKRLKRDTRYLDGKNQPDAFFEDWARYVILEDIEIVLRHIASYALVMPEGEFKPELREETLQFRRMVEQIGGMDARKLRHVPKLGLKAHARIAMGECTGWLRSKVPTFFERPR